MRLEVGEHIENYLREIQNNLFLQLFDPKELLEEFCISSEESKEKSGPKGSKTQLIKLDRNNQYAGNLVNGLPIGVGLMFYSNGDIYYGEFKDGMRHGQGCQ